MYSYLAQLIVQSCGDALTAYIKSVQVPISYRSKTYRIKVKIRMKRHHRAQTAATHKQPKEMIIDAKEINQAIDQWWQRRQTHTVARKVKPYTEYWFLK